MGRESGINMGGRLMAGESRGKDYTEGEPSKVLQSTLVQDKQGSGEGANEGGQEMGMFASKDMELISEMTKKSGGTGKVPQQIVGEPVQILWKESERQEEECADRMNDGEARGVLQELIPNTEGIRGQKGIRRKGVDGSGGVDRWIIMRRQDLGRYLSCKKIPVFQMEKEDSV